MPAFMAYGYCTPLVQCTCCYPLFCMRRGYWFSCTRVKRIPHDNVLNRQEMVLIGMPVNCLSSGDLDAGGITFIPSLDSKGDNDG
ncbi:Uncharacterised protein [Escherichia coli]|uniref:Uncharacterized protein n=1 Tax=Escherichia coli TaxID=562 RepID=A0A377K641_ECOLX|nr:Uncharacterised protein [Escherichia coli]